MKCIALALLLLVSLAAPTWADFDEGLAAYKRGDYATANREFRPLAEAGNADAQSRLGFMYIEGLGVPQDGAEAVKWFRKAAEQGNVNAQIALGFMYHKGRGVPQDDVEAAKWTRKAAEQGDATSQDLLGFTYALGRGVRQDYVMAYMWFTLAAARGHTGAKANRDKFAKNKNMTPAQIAEAKRLARQWKPKKE